MPIQLSGSLVITGSITTTGVITMSGSIASATSASYSSTSDLLQGTGSVGFATTASLLTVSSSQQQISASQQQISSSLLQVSASYISLSASYTTFSGSASTRISNNETASNNLTNASASFSTRTTQIENVYATTGSNTFTGIQNFSNTCTPNSFTAGASIYTAGGLQVTQDTYFSSSVYIKGNVTVYGTQSVSYVSSSQFNIGTNIITVNTFTPSVRYGGLSVFDSGSTGLTGSIFWDSELNRWIYVNASGSGGGATYGGGMFISGPRNSQGIGCEQGTTACMLLAGQGGDHLTSSMIYHDSAVTCIPNAIVGGSTACFTGNTIVSTTGNTTLTINGTSGVPALSFTNTGGTNNIYGGVGSVANITIAPGDVNAVKIFAVGCISCFAGTVCAPNLYMNGGIINQQSGDLSFWVPNVGQALTITQNTGRVGIGTISPDRKLDIASANASDTKLVIRTACGFAGSYSPSLDFHVGGYESTCTTGQIKMCGTNNYSGDMIFSTQLSGTINPLVERMRISCGGNVGIGTINPSQKLHVVGSAIIGCTTANSGIYGCYLYFPFTSENLSNGTNRAYIQFDSVVDSSVNQNDTWRWKMAAVARCGNLGCYNSSLEFLRTTRDGVTDQSVLALNGYTGNVGIGTCTPSAKLHINGSTGASTYKGFAYTYAGSETLTNEVLFQAVVGGYSSNLPIFLFKDERSDQGTTQRIFEIQGGRSGVGTILTTLANGNVGIGCTAPSDPLTIGGGQTGLSINSQTTGDAYIRWRKDGTTKADAYLDRTNEDLYVGTASGAGGLYLKTVGCNRLFVTSTGIACFSCQICTPKIQINTSTDCGQLNIIGYDNGGINIIDTRTSDSGCYYSAITFRDYYLANSAQIKFYHNQYFGAGVNSIRLAFEGSDKFLLTYGGISCFAGTVCAPCFATISDYRMKSNLRPIDGLSIIMNTKPYKFEYNYDCSTSFGMIAHELQDTLPEAVFGQKDGEVMQGVDYMKLLPITIKAIQEQQCTICSQTSMINILKTCLGIN